jgi:hypothetical protein
VLVVVIVIVVVVVVVIVVVRCAALCDGRINPSTTCLASTREWYSICCDALCVCSVLNRVCLRTAEVPQ